MVSAGTLSLLIAVFIMEVAAILHETIYDLHPKKLDGIIFRIEIEKAYDKV